MSETLGWLLFFLSGWFCVRGVVAWGQVVQQGESLNTAAAAFATWATLLGVGLPGLVVGLLLVIVGRLGRIARHTWEAGGHAGR